MGKANRGYIVIRGVAAEASVNTMKEVVISTPCDMASKWAMLIEKITMEIIPGSAPAARPTADAGVSLLTEAVLSTAQGVPTMPSMATNGTLMKGIIDQFEASQTADGGNAASTIGERLQHQEYPKGLLVADKTLSLYVQGGSGHASVSAVAVCIFFSLVKLTTDEFMAALSVMEAL